VGGDAVFEEFTNRRPIGNDKASESPLVAEDIGQQEFVGGNRPAVEVVEAGHEGGDVGVDRSFERWQIDVAQDNFRNVGRMIIAAGLRGAASGKMFRAGEDSIDARKVVTLKAAHPGARDGAAEERILAGGFHDAAPTRIAGDVDHGGEGPMLTGGGRLNGGDALGFFDGGEIPGSGLAEVDREDGAVAVDDVEAEEERDLDRK